MERGILEQIDSLNHKVKAFGELSLENKYILDKKLRLEFNFNTNHLEGNTLTYSETELLLIFDDAKGDHTLREFEEMKGSDVAYQLIHEWAEDKERPLTEQWIKSLNEILLVRPFWKEAQTSEGQKTRRQILVGDYKQYPNSVILSNGEMFHYASPSDTPILMGELIEWFRDEETKSELPPVQLAALLHYKFVKIHPFDDGNGRISRLLMNYVLLRNNLPPVIIKSNDKRNYLQALNRADTGDIDAFCNYIARQLIVSLELTIKAAKGENLDEPGDLDKKIKLLKQKLKIDKKVKITKSPASILNVLNSCLEPLFNEISTKLSDFDIFFKSRIDELITPNSSAGLSLSKGLFYLKNYLKENQISSISYFYRLQDFRQGKVLNLECHMKVIFHMNVYELTSEQAKFNLSKLYDEVLTEQEINLIVEALGTYALDKIEKAL